MLTLPRAAPCGARRTPATDSGHQKILVRGQAFPAGGQFDSPVCGQVGADCDRPLVQKRGAAVPLPVLGPRAVLRSRSACHWMTSGSGGSG